MAEKKKHTRPMGSLQPDIEDMLEWNTLTADDFAPASTEEKEGFIQERKSVSYWSDAWRRLRKNKVAMVAMVILILIFLFAFVGPLIVPYGYAEFSQKDTGGENLHPWHYSLEDQARLAAELEARTGAAS